MATEINVATATVVETNRKAISLVGSAFGTQYYKPFAVLCHQKQDEDELIARQSNNANIILNRSPRRFRMRGSDVVSMKIEANAVTHVSEVVINKGTKDELIIPINSDMTQAGVVTEDAIAKSLHGDTTVFFKDPRKLANYLNGLNRTELSNLEELEKIIKKCKDQIMSSIRENEDKAAKFASQFTMSADGTVVIPADVALKATDTGDNTVKVTVETQG